MNLKPIILCGGSGSRLWPISRESYPKQFIPFFKSKTLFDLAIERAIKINNKTCPIVVVSKKYEFLVHESFKKFKKKSELILEPIGKNTTAAIYLAAKKSKPGDVLLIMPADHMILDLDKFKETIDKAKKVVKKNNPWITFGIKPTSPSDAYGYIKTSGENLEDGFTVSNFIEKPDFFSAIKMLEEGNHFWNSGIFLATRDVILDDIKKHASEIANACEYAWENSDFSDKQKVSIDYKSFNMVKSISIDYAIMEKINNIKLFPLETEWSDVGSWDSFSKINKNQNSKNLYEIDSQNNFIFSKDKIVATIGVEDSIIINTNDATLVMKKGNSEKVKDIVQKLKIENRPEADEHDFEYRPWGYFRNIYHSKSFKVKYLLVNPLKRLSLQYHTKRSEHWVIVEGIATVHLNGKVQTLKVGQSIDIPKLSEHYIANYELTNLILIEVQMGTYFGEDDIVRLDDPYKR